MTEPPRGDNLGAPLYAPGAGVVVEAVDGVDDNTKSKPVKPVMEEVLKNP